MTWILYYSTQMEMLASARRAEDPKLVLSDLSSACERLNISSHDIYGDFTCSKDNSWLRTFELEVSQYFGKENGLFLISGTMAQGIALKVNEELHQSQLSQESSFLVHYSSHLLLHENCGYDSLYRMKPVIIESDPDALSQNPLSYDDIETNLQSCEHKGCLPHTVIIEVPHREIGGKCTSYTDIEKISKLCKQYGEMQPLIVP